MTRDLAIPLDHYREIVLRFPGQALSEQDWAVLMAVLAAMRPALVEPGRPGAALDNTGDPLQLTPDEAIEVSLALRDHLAVVGPTVRRGTDLEALADRLIAHERATS